MANDYSRFLDVLPQQYPMRLIDEIVDFKEGESLTAIKNITGSEWVFDNGATGPVDHFPETLIIEAAAQAALCYFNVKSKSTESQKFMLGQINAEFSNQANIGECLILKTDMHKSMKKSGYMDVHCLIEDKQVANVTIFYGLLD